MTLADFKRDIKSGNIRLELVERYGETGDAIPERCRGIRKVKSANTVEAILETKSGLISSLPFPPAKLIEYSGESLTIYERGERELTEQEQKILAEWRRIETEYEKRNPYSNCYWKKKEYFKNCPCPWLAGFETVRGKYYNCDGKVVDSRVRGKAILKYKVHILEAYNGNE